MSRTFPISNLDGSNKRRITKAQYRAELNERAVYAKAVMDAAKRGDMTAVAAAQAEMRKRFS